jgi:hypothetical protein
MAEDSAEGGTESIFMVLSTSFRKFIPDNAMDPRVRYSYSDASSSVRFTRSKFRLPTTYRILNLETAHAMFT